MVKLSYLGLIAAAILNITTGHLLPISTPTPTLMVTTTTTPSTPLMAPTTPLEARQLVPTRTTFVTITVHDKGCKTTPHPLGPTFTWEAPYTFHKHTKSAGWVFKKPGRRPEMVTFTWPFQPKFTKDTSPENGYIGP
ncbi:hypothetical protein BU16DRAFT_542190 [Lophium mytilinum]|uniref:Uncharacterized protein n=1 Tax=Lophium mytilinum TaxID=390894 RepID=A0A6A6QJU2_9PEZI|nr:hypothetical protein BU16DRAFT_542190 [Lophium mytilinum]